MAKARVLTFTFQGAEAEQRGPLEVSSLVVRTLNAAGGKVAERFELAALPERIIRACAWYGLKQKLSDFEADQKGEMSGPERLASMRDCYAMLQGDAWEQEREGAVMTPPTDAEMVAAIQRMYPTVTEDQAVAAVQASAGKAPNADLLGMVRLMRKEAGIAGRTKGGDLGGLFK